MKKFYTKREIDVTADKSPNIMELTVNDDSNNNTNIDIIPTAKSK